MLLHCSKIINCVSNYSRGVRTALLEGGHVRLWLLDWNFYVEDTFNQIKYELVITDTVTWHSQWWAKMVHSSAEKYNFVHLCAKKYEVKWVTSGQEMNQKQCLPWRFEIKLNKCVRVFFQHRWVLVNVKFSSFNHNSPKLELVSVSHQILIKKLTRWMFYLPQQILDQQRSFKQH